MIIITAIIVVMKITKKCYVDNDKITVNEEKPMKMELQNASWKNIDMVDVDPHLG